MIKAPASTARARVAAHPLAASSSAMATNVSTDPAGSAPSTVRTATRMEPPTRFRIRIAAQSRARPTHVLPSARRWLPLRDRRSLG